MWAGNNELQHDRAQYLLQRDDSCIFLYMIRFGIAGFGLHAVRRLMPGFALARNCKGVALSRRDSNKAREAAVQYGIPHVFASTQALCRWPEVDAGLCTTSYAGHLRDVLS